MRSVSAIVLASALLGGTLAAAASECAGRPDALGVERVLVVDPSEHGRIGTMQYPETLPLNDKEVVLTFDDGPLPPYTTRVLQTLAAECVKATFFLVGRQSRAYPGMVRRLYNEGHTVATHSQNHPRIFTRLQDVAAHKEIDDGIAAANAALGDERALAPFFRFPGLGRSPAIESYLASHNVMVWSADFPADDWTHISGAKVMARALERLERKGKGVLLLHDIQPATALMLPQLLRELKARGYRIVHVVPAGPDRPKTVTEPQSWVMRKPVPQWPRIVEPAVARLPAPSAESFGWPHPFRIRQASAIPQPLFERLGGLQAPPPLPAWSPAPHVGVVTRMPEPTLQTAASPESFPAPSVTAMTLAPMPETIDTIVVPQAVLAQMIAPSAWSGKTRPRHPAAKPRARTAAPPAPRPAALKPPLALSTPPQLVARTPAQTTR